MRSLHGDGDAFAAPWVTASRQGGGAVGGARLGSSRGFSGAGCERVFKGQAAVIQMAFHKEGCRGVGEAKRIGGLSDLWMKEGVRLRANILESED